MSSSPRALIQAMLHADRWGAVACHSADVDFDLVYRPEMAQALDTLARHDGDVEKAKTLLPGTLALVDRTAKLDAIHASAADRTKSRLTRAFNRLGEGS